MFFKKRNPSPVAPPGQACKVCGCNAEFFGAVDFSKNCLLLPLPPSGIQVPYFHCGNCGFLFTNLCDKWTPTDFARRIYNDDYVKVDPDFTGARALREADRIAGPLATHRHSLRVLDYGGGSGTFARRLRELGFDAFSFDPYHPCDLAPPEGERFALVHCSEVLEHANAPREVVAELAQRMSEDAVAVMTTALLPLNRAEVDLDWWYIGPRNGHISIHSVESLAMLWEENGFEFGFFDGSHHIAWRGHPTCLASLIDSFGTLHRTHAS